MYRYFGIALMIGMIFCCCAQLIGESARDSLSVQSTESATAEMTEEATSPPQEFEITPEVPMLLFDNSATSVEEAAFETLKILQDAQIPINDSRDLAVRLGGRDFVPETLEAPAPVYLIGDRQTFWVTNVDTNETFQIDAVLRYATPHVYFWIQSGVRYQEVKLINLVELFEKTIYPKNREFFGSEWTPGIDHDPHLYILYVRGVGSIGGYFSANDSVHPLAHKYSNAHEMFIVSADYVDLDSEAASVLAHEFQHMIHWYRDRNEESWVNEGFSVLAEFLNGYDIGWVDDAYVSQPDIQLTFWPSVGESYPYYGSAFMFLNYFLNRFGEEATRTLVALPENGLVGIDTVLSKLGITDSKTGEVLTADDVFSDWVVANYLNDTSLGDGRYGYVNFSDAPKPVLTEVVNSCPTDWQVRTVNQYGVDYIGINCSGDYVIEFQGASEVQVLPENAHSGKYFFWSNKGDEADMTLIRSFDFRKHTGSLTLEYWVWYDIEEDYDYVYLVASEDGIRWQILNTPSGTSADPSGNNYGWGYNGKSNGWVHETVDLSRFSGKQIYLGFEYVTDAAVNGEGFLLDDISIPEIGYFDDFEQDGGDWEAHGFVRIQNLLPQTFRVSLVELSETSAVESRAINPGQFILLPLNWHRSTEQFVLVVSGTTRFTHQSALYQFRVSPQNGRSQ